MGGMGSGNWTRPYKKSTVEESWALSIWDLRDGIFPEASGEIDWKHQGEISWSIGFFIEWDEEGPTLTLHYYLGSESIVIPIRLESTPTNFGGNRWWFTCPNHKNGEPCQRRSGKLYLPAHETILSPVRACHDLDLLKASQDSRIAGIGCFGYYEIAGIR